MQTLLGMNLAALWALIIAGAVILGYAFWILRREQSALYGLIAGLRTLPVDDTTRHFAMVKEGKAMSPEAAASFYQMLAQRPEWSVLAQKYQADTRFTLQRAYQAAVDGNQTGAQFFLGVAWYASNQATLPEREIEQALRMLHMKQQQAEADAEEQKRSAESIRPSRF